MTSDVASLLRIVVFFLKAAICQRRSVLVNFWYVCGQTKCSAKEALCFPTEDSQTVMLRLCTSLHFVYFIWFRLPCDRSGPRISQERKQKHLGLLAPRVDSIKIYMARTLIPQSHTNARSRDPSTQRFPGPCRITSGCTRIPDACESQARAWTVRDIGGFKLVSLFSVQRLIQFHRAHLISTQVGILNLGDSGVMLLRPALRTPPSSDQPLLFPRVIFRSSDQTHYFNCPYQLGSGSALVEAPDYIRIRVRAGDIVVAATDGVFDNLFDHQVRLWITGYLHLRELGVPNLISDARGARWCSHAVFTWRVCARP